MKIVNVIGGIGNQLFQYAFFLALKDNYNETVKLDILRFDSYGLHNGYELEKVFSIREIYCTEAEKRALSSDGGSSIEKGLRKLGLLKKKQMIEKKMEEYTFCSRLLGQPFESIYYRGHWQSYKYFKHIEEDVKSQLKFPQVTDKANLDLLEKMKGNNTVSIHVRRGDYLNHPEFGNVCSLHYYQSAINEIDKNISSPLYIIFSNDIAWCKDNLKLVNSVYVDWNIEEDSFRDLQLMSLCGNNIIANSSFSWWGAFLNENSDKLVIAPSKWTQQNRCKELIPNSWIRLEVETYG